MLSKKNRLSRIEIEDLKAGRRNVIQGKFFGLIYQKTDQPGKFGLIISNKVVAKSVERNKIKRLLYSIIGTTLSSLNGQFLFLAKRNCVGGSLDDFKREMEEFQLKVR